MRNLLGNQMVQSIGEDSEASPMESVGNVTDAILVFALGLMLALMTNWNISLNTPTEVIQSDQATEIDEPDQGVVTSADGTAYTRMGSVYRDPDTGKLYMVVEDTTSGD